jgi:hypothetical protein
MPKVHNTLSVDMGSCNLVNAATAVSGISQDIQIDPISSPSLIQFPPHRSHQAHALFQKLIRELQSNSLEASSYDISRSTSNGTRCLLHGPLSNLFCVQAQTFQTNLWFASQFLRNLVRKNTKLPPPPMTTALSSIPKPALSFTYTEVSLFSDLNMLTRRIISACESQRNHWKQNFLAEEEK